MEQTQNTDSCATNENSSKTNIRTLDAASTEEPSEQTMDYFSI